MSCVLLSTTKIWFDLKADFDTEPTLHSLKWWTFYRLIVQFAQIACIICFGEHSYRMRPNCNVQWIVPFRDTFKFSLELVDVLFHDCCQVLTKSLLLSQLRQGLSQQYIKFYFGLQATILDVLCDILHFPRKPAKFLIHTKCTHFPNVFYLKIVAKTSFINCYAYHFSFVTF